MLHHGVLFTAARLAKLPRGLVNVFLNGLNSTTLTEDQTSIPFPI